MFELDGSSLDDCDPQFATRVSTFASDPLALPDDGTHFGFVARGFVRIISPLMPEFTARAGNYFALAGPVTLTPQGDACGGLVATRLGYRGLNCVGGPIESQGRLKYIDGCTDTLLIAPVRWGDACLNLLFFPPGIDQTEHTHPSVRCGVVASGSGECHSVAGVAALRAGAGFVIHPNAPHKFRTESEAMIVIAYHPDSDFGPRDEEHPMINRTMIGNVSAKHMAGIRTR